MSSTRHSSSCSRVARWCGGGSAAEEPEADSHRGLAALTRLGTEPYGGRDGTRTRPCIRSREHVRAGVSGVRPGDAGCAPGCIRGARRHRVPGGDGALRGRGTGVRWKLWRLCRRCAVLRPAARSRAGRLRRSRRCAASHGCHRPGTPPAVHRRVRLGDLRRHPGRGGGQAILPRRPRGDGAIRRGGGHEVHCPEVVGRGARWAAELVEAHNLERPMVPNP
jgi:hypothetical protein